MFQHITENDFLIRLLGGSIQDLGIGASTSTSTSSAEEAVAEAAATPDDARRRRARSLHGEDGVCVCIKCCFVLR